MGVTAHPESAVAAKVPEKELLRVTEQKTVQEIKAPEKPVPAVAPPAPSEREAVKKPSPPPGKEAEALLVEPEAPPLPQTAEELAQMEPSQGRRYSIRLKMISFISAIILISLSSMILLASYFFRGDTEVRIKENSLTLTQVIGQQVETQLNAISYKSQIIAETLRQRFQSAEAKKRYIETFLRNNDDILFVGFASRGPGDALHVQESIYNRLFLEEHGISEKEIERMYRTNNVSFLPSFSGAVVVVNLSPVAQVPLLGLSIPSPGKLGSELILVFVDPAKILKTFQKTGIVTTFMVDSQGNVVAHPDSKMVLSSTNLMDQTIVQRMMESKIGNEHTRYTDPEGNARLGSFQKINFAGLGIISTVKEDLAFRAVRYIQYRNVLIMFIVMLTAVLIIFFFARSLSIPIVKLVGATRQVEQGDYSVGIAPTSRDEVGTLTESFLRMANGLQEREKMKDAFGKFVNKELAEIVMKGEVKLGGEKKECAIFFSDLRGFTAMSEGLEPEEVVEFLNEYFTVMVDCVNRTHGIVDKFIGDAIMAHWGALVTHGNNTENAVNAAVMMRKALIEFNNRPSPEGKKRPLARMGCGINTGPVISGQIGSEERLEYTVIGDAVNLASRIEALNKPFYSDILISQDSYEQVKHIFNVERMPSIKVKGKTEPQTIFAVLGRKDDPECPSSMDEVRRMVGIDTDESKMQKGDVFMDEDKEVKYEILEK